MSRRTPVRLLTFLLLAAAAPATRAQEPLVIHTQNLLRFGQGSKTAAKCAALATMSAQVDVIIIQELMTQTYPCFLVPAGFTWCAYGPRGTTTYREWYGFLVRTTPRVNGPTITLAAQNRTAPGKYERPPEAILLNVTMSGQTTPAHRLWVGNIHSIWGKNGVTPRRTEATLAATFYTSLKTTPVDAQPVPTNGYPVIIAGDWNLGIRTASNAIDEGFQALDNANAGLDPNVATSLTRAGAPSSPYDHFAWTDATLTVTGAAVYPANGWPNWRTTTSDHLGVRVNVTFKP